jgi:hypothetical protein
MTVIGALSSFRELGEMSPHKRARVHRFTLTGCRLRFFMPARRKQGGQIAERAFCVKLIARPNFRLERHTTAMDSRAPS